MGYHYTAAVLSGIALSDHTKILWGEKKILCMVDTAEEHIAILDQVMNKNRLLMVNLDKFFPSYFINMKVST